MILVRTCIEEVSVATSRRKCSGYSYLQLKSSRSHEKCFCRIMDQRMVFRLLPELNPFRPQHLQTFPTVTLLYWNPDWYKNIKTFLKIEKSGETHEKNNVRSILYVVFFLTQLFVRVCLT